MSCRVLKRGMEFFVLNYIVSLARDSGFKCIIGEYLKSLKNDIVSNHYLNLGFEPYLDLWKLSVIHYFEKENFITIKK